MDYTPRVYSHGTLDFKLNLPVLKSLQLVGLDEIRTLTVDAPRLQRIKLAQCSASLRLNLVHAESVKRLVIANMKQTAIQELKNLEYIYCRYASNFAPTFLSDLQLLKEIHFGDLKHVQELLDQKQRDGRADLKIYLCGLLLNSPDDLVMTRSFRILRDETFAFLAKNPSRSADEILLVEYLQYESIESVSPGSEFNVLKRLTDLDQISVFHPVQDIQRFLSILKNLDSIVCLYFHCDQPELFDRLPEHCAVQSLHLSSVPSDILSFFSD